MLSVLIIMFVMYFVLRPNFDQSALGKCWGVEIAFLHVFCWCVGDFARSISAHFSGKIRALISCKFLNFENYSESYFWFVYFYYSNKPFFSNSFIAIIWNLTLSVKYSYLFLYSENHSNSRQQRRLLGSKPLLPG